MRWWLDDGVVAGKLQLAGRVPSGTVISTIAGAFRAAMVAELVEIQPHGLSIRPWQHETRTLAVCRRDSTEQISVRVVLIGGVAERVRRDLRAKAPPNLNARRRVVS